jgi:hypothetical protein
MRQSLALLIAGLRILPAEVPRLHYAQRLDLPGAVTLTAAMLLLVRTLVEAPSSGWGSGATVRAFAVTALLLGAFVVIERRSRSPLLRLGPVVQRVGTERLIAVGFLGIVIGYGLLLRIAATPSWVAVLLPTTLFVGAGIGVAFPPLNIQAVAGIGPHEQGIAGAIFQASNQIGAAVVLAVVTAVITSSGGASTERPVLLAAYRDGLLVVAAVAAAGLLIALSALVWRPVAAEAPA